MSVHEQTPEDYIEGEPKPTYEQYLVTTLDAIARYQAGNIDMEEVYLLIAEVTRLSGRVAGNISKQYLDQLSYEYESGPNHHNKVAKLEERKQVLEQQLQELQDEKILLKQHALVELNSVVSDSYATAHHLRIGYVASYDDLMGALDDIKQRIKALDVAVVELWAFYPMVGQASDSAKMSHDSEKFQEELQYRAKKARALSGYKDIVELAGSVKKTALINDGNHRLTEIEKGTVRRLANQVYLWSAEVTARRSEDIDERIKLCRQLLEPLTDTLVKLQKTYQERKAETEKLKFDETIEKVKERLNDALARSQTRL